MGRLTCRLSVAGLLLACCLFCHLCIAQEYSDRVFDNTNEQTQVNDQTTEPADRWAQGLIIFLLTLLSAIASGVGALPLLFVHANTTRWKCLSNALAAGLMTSASLTLGFEAFDYGLKPLVVGIFFGCLFVVSSELFLSRFEEFHISNASHLDSKKMILVMTVMTLHSFAEGLGMGASFAGDSQLGVFISIAMAIHNMPEGLAIAVVMIPRGVRPWNAALWATFSSLPQPIIALPAFLFIIQFRWLTPWALAFASGAMLWMVVSEILPDSYSGTGSRVEVSLMIVSSMALMWIFQYYVLGALLDV